MFQKSQQGQLKESLAPEKHFKHIYRGKGRVGSMKKKRNPKKNKNIEPEPKIQYSYKKKKGVF